MQNNSIRVLLVDDDSDYADVAKHLLNSFQNKKFDLIWKQDGESALEILRSTKNIDVVLMDYYLPNKNGLEITKQLYDDKISIPIIFLTANKDFHVAVEAIKYGAEDYLIKTEAVGTVLPRMIVNVIERVQLMKHIKRLEQEKIISQNKTEVIKQLVVTMCHEFNNPLAAIKISTDILSRQQIPDPDKQLLTNMNKNIILLEKKIIELRDLNLGNQ
jgi:CheY-like chemotaxis protein